MDCKKIDRYTALLYRYTDYIMEERMEDIMKFVIEHLSKRFDSTTRLKKVV